MFGQEGNDEYEPIKPILNECGTADYGSVKPTPPSTAEDQTDIEEGDGIEETTTWRRELYLLVKGTLPMLLSFFLQFSEQFAGVFSLGHLGRVQLAAASLASMTAAITGLTIFTGIASSLDTLCSQAHGNGQRHALGLHTQRCLLLELICFIPISIVWLNVETIMLSLKQDPELAYLCGRFLKFYWFGAPGYAIFEALKRYQQAQNIFHASTCVLLITAPLNVLL